MRVGGSRSPTVTVCRALLPSPSGNHRLLFRSKILTGSLFPYQAGATRELPLLEGAVHFRPSRRAPLETASDWSVNVSAAKTSAVILHSQVSVACLEFILRMKGLHRIIETTTTDFNTQAGTFVQKKTRSVLGVLMIHHLSSDNLAKFEGSSSCPSNLVGA